jgi:PAS domain S-box-containing protein
MSLQSKVILILCAAVALMIGLHLAIQRWVILPGFVEVETRAADADIDRCVRAVDHEIANIDRTCHDWAAWNDMYDNTPTPAPEWVAGNIDAEAFSLNKLDVGQIVGTDGRVMWQQAIDSRTAEPIPFVGLPTTRYADGARLVSHGRSSLPIKARVVAGIVMVGERPLLVASRPIVTSDNQGPIRGALILGHFLTDEDVRNLSEQTRVRFVVRPAREVEPGTLAALSRLDARGAALVERPSDATLHASRLYRDIDGRPALALVATVRREITQRGAAALRDALVLAVVSILALVGVVLLVALRVAVLRPLSGLNHHVRSIQASGDYSARLNLGRGDEIGSLADAFDQLMALIRGDISRREETEVRLRESDRLYHLLTETIGDLIAVCDAERRLTHASLSYQTVLGQETEALIGQPVEVLVHPDDRAEVLARLEQGEDAARSVSMVYRMSHADGRWLWFETFGKAISGPGEKLTGWVFNSREITARRHAEEERARLEDQLRQAQKLESIGRLAGGVAHDFNNLLTGITLSVEMMLYDPFVAEPMRHDLQDVKAAAERAAALTAQLLAFGRKQVIDPKIVDLNQLVAGSVAMLKRLIGEDVELTFTPGAGLGMLKVDRSQMEQVLVNLAINARDAMPEGGELSIETADAVVNDESCRSNPEAAPGRYVRWSVRDTGTGMPPEVMARLFEPFFTTKETGKGTGLGLSTIYGIVKQNRGFITVESKVGEGSTFAVYLPVASSLPPAAIATAERTTSTMGQETVMLVEDEEVVRNLTRRLLERAGYTVIVAERGDEAYSMLAANPDEIDLLLTDVIMPGMNGGQLYENAKRLKPDLRVIYMSGYTADAIAHHGVLDGTTVFIQKPFEAELLIRRVREVLDAR